MKIINYKFKIKNCKGLARRQAGMTYVELIVVLGIFAIMSSIVMYNYGDFQARVDIKNLASDIALKIVEAQKSSLNGVLPTSVFPPDGWKPSYGVYFSSSSTADLTHSNASNKEFVYFVDLLNAGTGYDGTGTATLDPITITKSNYIAGIDLCDGITSCALNSHPSTPLSIFFRRPDSSAIFNGATVTGSQYIQITIQSPKTAMALIKIYPSGRVQVN